MDNKQEFYANFELDDFINDDNFIKWVKYPNEESNAHWNQVIHLLPNKLLLVNHAKSIVFLLAKPEVGSYTASKDKVWLGIEKELKQGYPLKRTLYNFPRIAAAALLVLSLSAGLYFTIRYSKSDTETAMIAIRKNDVAPGGAKATLTLQNGHIIDLNNAVNGKLAEQAGVTVEKTRNGELIYTAKEQRNSTEEVTGSNTVSTPRGGQYQLILPDKTHVWLNAASSITYPVTFAHATKRIVEISGEAYFEVAHNKNLPFIVRTQSQQVEVLGTHFNINSYSNEGKTVTTLEEGSVLVTPSSSIHTAKDVMLKPGQQSVLAGTEIKVLPADIETTLAWKNGRLEFKDADLQTIMREVSRWYNVDVEYKGELPHRLFVGSVPRQSNLSTLLELLRLSKINFSINDGPNGKKLIVSPDE